MAKKCGLALALALLVSVTACRERNAAASTVFVRVTADDGSEGECSGVVVADDGYILSCYHCLFGEPDFVGEESGVPGTAFDQVPDVKVRVTFDSGTKNARTVPATIVRTYPRADLAVLKSDIDTSSRARLVAESAEQSASVVAVGFPLGADASFSAAGPEASIRPGSIALLRRNDDGSVVEVDHTASIDFGMSGGPLFDENGEIVGINARGTGKTNLAVGPSVLRAVLDNALQNAPLDYRVLGLAENAELRIWNRADRRARTLRKIPLFNHTRPAWSADEKYLAYECYCDERNEVYVTEIATGHSRKVTGGPFGSFSPAWSSDGRIAVTTGGRTFASIKIYAGDQVKTIESRTRYLAFPTWSPDGSRLAAIQRTRNNRGDLVVIDASTGTISSLGLNGIDASTPSWSVRNEIVFAGRARGNTDIYRYDMSTRSLERLTRNASRDMDPSWSPDGQIIYYTAARRGRHHVISMTRTGEASRSLIADTVNLFGPAAATDRVAYYAVRTVPTGYVADDF